MRSFENEGAREGGRGKADRAGPERAQREAVFVLISCLLVAHEGPISLLRMLVLVPSSCLVLPPFFFFSLEGINL